MRLSERRMEGTFCFVVQHATGEVVGGEVAIEVFAAHDGDSELLVRRTLYFDEQSHEHIDNFCKEFAYDEHYRKLCLEGAAHWQRVARLYEANARIMADEQDLTPNALEKSGLEMFHFIRRDLARIESQPEYQEELARVSRGDEDDLQEALAHLARIKGLRVAAACQGSAMLQMEERRIYLPTCHTFKATITMSSCPQRLKNYLHTGPLGQKHLATFAENQISAVDVFRNKKFIRILTAALQAYLKKYGGKGSQ